MLSGELKQKYSQKSDDIARFTQLEEYFKATVENINASCARIKEGRLAIITSIFHLSQMILKLLNKYPTLKKVVINKKYLGSKEPIQVLIQESLDSEDPIAEFKKLLDAVPLSISSKSDQAALKTAKKRFETALENNVANMDYFGRYDDNVKSDIFETVRNYNADLIKGGRIPIAPFLPIKFNQREVAQLDPVSLTSFFIFKLKSIKNSKSKDTRDIQASLVLDKHFLEAKELAQIKAKRDRQLYKDIPKSMGYLDRLELAEATLEQNEVKEEVLRKMEIEEFFRKSKSSPQLKEIKYDHSHMEIQVPQPNQDRHCHLPETPTATPIVNAKPKPPKTPRTPPTTADVKKSEGSSQVRATPRTEENKIPSQPLTSNRDTLNSRTARLLRYVSLAITNVFERLANFFSRTRINNDTIRAASLADARRIQSQPKVDVKVSSQIRLPAPVSTRAVEQSKNLRQTYPPKILVANRNYFLLKPAIFDNDKQKKTKAEQCAEIKPKSKALA
jgi:hypothetical protein